ncbi:pulmonary surfactant-associated protein C-like [Calypte anna]|uniref:pulmonary surfactant-associated protein C n=1 Tax=Calypte anna TaxID=9244 RepID=UPI0004C1EA11|nr:pulmonary surfactant-associated protein C [Calypte anna]XP_030319792.1 pulmonary surfactant-associated protein C-like [Calypte anna]
MDESSKEALMEEAPPSYTASSRPPYSPPQLKSLLVVVLVVLVLTVVIVTFLLLGLHITETHAETVLRMTIQGLDGEGTPPQHLSMSKKERTGTFAVQDGLNASAVVVYDYSKLLVSYRSWSHRACYITRMDKDNIPGLDAVTQTFQHRQAEMKEVGDNVVALADRSILGTTVNILCSSVPVYWA